MIRILSAILFLAFGQTLFGQKISVDTLFLPITERFSNTQNEKLKFPVIRTGNLQVDKLINTDLKNRFTNYEYSELPTDSALMKWADGVIYLDFQVTYVKNGLISLNITGEGCGAYCRSWTDYYTYNYLTGEYVTIEKVVDTTGQFRNRVIADKDKQYKQQTVELKERLNDNEKDFDKHTYEVVLEYYTDCSKSFHFESFALHADHLEIIENCHLPNVIKSMEPVIELNYKYTDIKDYLKIKN